MLSFLLSVFLVSKEFTFAAAHYLTKYHGKCERLHGHNFRLRVSVAGSKAENGMVVDFVLLKKLVKAEVIDNLDHHNVNDFLQNPTAENLIEWIWAKLDPLPEKLNRLLNEPNFPPEVLRLFKEAKDAKLDRLNEQITLRELTLWETEDSFVTYRGPHEKF